MKLSANACNDYEINCTSKATKMSHKFSYKIDQYITPERQ